jgi:hypothetical protein
MWGSSILDVAMGVVFGFLAISLFTSAAVEAINSALRLRAVNLKSGIMALVNDPDFEGLAKRLYQHALISPLGPGDPAPNADSPSPTPSRPGADNSTFLSRAKDVLCFWREYGPPYVDIRTLPSYVDKEQFARALLDVTGLTNAKAEDAKVGSPFAQPPSAELYKAIDDLRDPQIRDFLKGAAERTGGDLKLVADEVANWFDAAMDRVSGEFKRWTQALTFIIALAAAVVFNVDTIQIGAALWEQPSVAGQLKPPDHVENADYVKSEERAIAEIRALLDAGLPIGWPSGHFFEVSDGHGGWPYIWSSSTFARAILGWFITAFAALFGAPFWFDTLQMVIRLKGSGPSPAEKASKQAASA